MAVCGGGCMGFVDLSTGVRALGYLERTDLPRGPVALVSHSGSAFSALLRTRRRIGWTSAVSSGQELVTTTADYLEHALDDPGTRAVALVLETVREPARLRAALDRATRQDVAVALLAVGGTESAGLVTAHSGALAGADATWEALTEAHGLLRVHDLDELADLLELLTVGPTRDAHRTRCRHRHRARLRRGAGARRRHRPPRGRALRRPLLGHHGPVGRPARRRPRGRQPARRVGHRARHPGPVRGLPDRDGRRPARRGGSARGRPRRGVRRRRLVPAGRAGRGGRDRRARRRAHQRDQCGRPDLGRRAADVRRPRARGDAQRAAGARPPPVAGGTAPGR